MDQSIDEFSLISRYFKELTSQQDVVVGIGDDAAIVDAEQIQKLAVATDTLVASVHFPNNAEPEQIATRALCVNLSDMAAMGAVPKWFTLALTLPKAMASQGWLKRFSQGLAKVAAQYDIALIGGDTTAGPLSISITLLGDLPSRNGLCRDAAQQEDIIYVSGTLGDGAAALYELTQTGAIQNQRLTHRFYSPKPQVELGLGLQKYANACIDISDGLVADLRHICESSVLGASINSQGLPIHSDIKQQYPKQYRQWALTGGDDYQLCFTVAKNRQTAFEKWAVSSNRAVTAIGKMIPFDHNQDFITIDSENLPIASGGYTHFK